MNRLKNRFMGNQIIVKLTALDIWSDTQGQDMIEYALMAGFVAVAAGALMPGIATSITSVFTKVQSVMTAAAAE